tara:strand:+ start:442 stop:750 length:309 start_codon:yes stop_codon:yes gene_type:complete
MEIQTVEILEDGSFLVNKNISQGDDRQVTIPDNMSNRHRRKLQLWIDAGNTPDPFVAPVLTWEDNRAKEYPPIVDQLDDIYHNGIDGWKATIKATKDKYPKP